MSTIAPTLPQPTASTSLDAPAAATPLAPRVRHPRLRSAGAVLAGLVAIFATSTVTDAVMHATGVFPAPDAPPMSNALFLLALAYRCAFDTAGCWLAARLAPSRPMRHALVLGGIGTVLAALGGIVMWGAGPAWYPVALAASALPCAWLGGHVARRGMRAG
jgi:hypothetical protein